MDDLGALQKLSADDFTIFKDVFGGPHDTARPKNLGVGFYILHLWPNAIAKLEGIVDKDERILMIYLGNACLNTGDYVKSDQVFPKSKEAEYIWDPEWEQGMKLLALAYAEKGDAERAVTLLQQVIPSLSWDREDAILLLGGLYARSGQYRLEVELYDKAFKESTIWWKWQSIAEACIRNGNFQRAQGLYATVDPTTEGTVISMQNTKGETMGRVKHVGRRVSSLLVCRLANWDRRPEWYG